MKPKMIYKALLSIDNTFKFEVKSDGTLIWQDDRPQPTKDQIEAKIIELEAQEVKNQINKIATKIVQDKLKELDYDNEGEVALYANNTNSIWHDEAKKLQEWIEEIYKKMYELQKKVTIKNYKKIDLNNLNIKL